jgi:Tfp pilus assembly protein PilV
MIIALRAFMRDQRGVALPLALIALLILTMLVLTVLNLGAVEPTISRNLSDTARARQLAEAGIEWAFDCMADQDLSTFLAGPDNVQNNADDQLATSVAGQNIAARMDNTFCVNSPAPGALPGLTAATGTFSVTIRNDSIGAGGGYAGDQVLTGVAVDGGGKFVDTNGIVIVTATGTYGTATRQITAVLSRNTLTINGAANLPGMQADTYMNGVWANNTIDGRDWVRSDTNAGGPSGVGPLRFGITTQPGIQTNLGITY